MTWWSTHEPVVAGHPPDGRRAGPASPVAADGLAGRGAEARDGAQLGRGHLDDRAGVRHEHHSGAALAPPSASTCTGWHGARIRDERRVYAAQLRLADPLGRRDARLVAVAAPSS